MNEEPSLLHTSPQLPIAGRWVPVTHPPGGTQALVPDLAGSQMIDARADAGASPYDCVANVARVVAQSGGTPLCGWNLTQFYSSREKAHLIEAAAHVVWAPPQGAPMDVTPSASSNRMQSCFLPAGRVWKVLPGSLFFVPATASQSTIGELRLILEAKHTVRKYMQKNALVPGCAAVVDMQALYAYCRSHVKSPQFDMVFQFVRLELVRLKVTRRDDGALTAPQR